MNKTATYKNSLTDFGEDTFTLSQIREFRGQNKTSKKSKKNTKSKTNRIRTK